MPTSVNQVDILKKNIIFSDLQIKYDLQSVFIDLNKLFTNRTKVLVPYFKNIEISVLFVLEIT